MRKFSLLPLMSLGLIWAASASAQDGQPAQPGAAATVTETTPAAIDPKELKKQQAAEAKAAKAAAAAERKRKADLVRQYGEGPYPDETEAYVSAKPEALRPLYTALYTGGERNAVLNFNRLGLAAMEAGLWDEAEWAFDQSLTRIEAIFSDSPQASAARSIFHNEANKEFKGEPYERSMSYYYRGLLYLREGDYDNARASFKGAEFQDTLSDTETFQSDFAVMNYLIGWTQMCQGQNSSASESFEIAEKAQAGLVRPQGDHNVLMIAELGNGPLKARGGSSEELLTFVPGENYQDTSAHYILKPKAGKPMTLATLPASSVNFQATTRGGRAIDGLMKGKANWKSGTDLVGDSLMQTGLNQGSGAMMGIGLAMSIFSSAMKTKADIRAWDGLPDMINVTTARAESTDWDYEVRYLNGETALDMPGGPKMRADSGKCSLVWSRSRSLGTPSPTVFGEDMGVAKAVSRKKDVAAKDKMFRDSLGS